MHIQQTAPEAADWASPSPSTWPVHATEAEQIGDLFGALLWRARYAAWTEHSARVTEIARLWGAGTLHGEALSPALNALAAHARDADAAFTGRRFRALGIEVHQTGHVLQIQRAAPPAPLADEPSPETPAPLPTLAAPALPVDLVLYAEAVERLAGPGGVKIARTFLRIPGGDIGAVATSALQLREYIDELKKHAGPAAPTPAAAQP